MSNFDAFLTFANHVKSKVDETPSLGLSVIIEKQEIPARPYISIESGVSRSFGIWQESSFCNIRLCVERNSTEPLAVTVGRLVKSLIKRISDNGNLIKYDYTQSSPIAIGSVLYRYIGTSPDLSDDPLNTEIVLQFELFTNSSI